MAKKQASILEMQIEKEVHAPDRHRVNHDEYQEFLAFKQMQANFGHQADNNVVQEVIQPVEQMDGVIEADENSLQATFLINTDVNHPDQSAAHPTHVFGMGMGADITNVLHSNSAQ